MASSIPSLFDHFHSVVTFDTIRCEIDHLEFCYSVVVCFYEMAYLAQVSLVLLSFSIPNNSMNWALPHIEIVSESFQLCQASSLSGHSLMFLFEGFCVARSGRQMSGSSQIWSNFLKMNSTIIGHFDCFLCVDRLKNIRKVKIFFNLTAVNLQ